MGALLIGSPSKETEGWWRICFWVSAVPPALLALSIEFSPESPHWLFKKGRAADAEAAFEKLFGGPYVKGAIVDLSKSDRGDEAETVKLSELLYGHHRKGSFAALLVMDNLGRKYKADTLLDLWFVLAFAAGAGPVPSLLLSEMFPGRIRAKAMSVCLTVHWIGPLVLDTIFATFCSVAVIFVKRNVMETKGRSLQEIEITFLTAE
ncbi:Major facilitator superfamily protein isoform 2 [Hibiscus syriacus]|uniref:Major facilitator superfamily protein isoform 2 n=1 Tax=Hibiscus syriacus TaxID=106335 RepID=A0A6A3AZ86_HIBSY|nr:Major facilitator superfamily protein isoform 2 [Hibiscus syriacus]